MDPRDVCWLEEAGMHYPAMIVVDFNWNTRTSDGVSLSLSAKARIVFAFSYAWTWSLLVSDVSEDDAGEYTCRVSSDDRTLTIIKRFNFTVLSKH
jgi:hypothetical protein